MEDVKRYYATKIIAMLMKLDEKRCRQVFLLMAGLTTGEANE